MYVVCNKLRLVYNLKHVTTCSNKTVTLSNKTFMKHFMKNVTGKWTNSIGYITPFICQQSFISGATVYCTLHYPHMPKPIINCACAEKSLLDAPHPSTPSLFQWWLGGTTALQRGYKKLGLVFSHQITQEQGQTIREIIL